jgi:hypothetical protein
MKKISTFVQLTVLVAAFASISMADVMPFQWSTTGTFSAPGLPAGLSFTGAALSVLTNTAANGNLSIADLGHFTFGNIATDYTGTFTLTVNFLRPDGSPDSVNAVTLVADANVSGGNDNLTITFPSASLYNFAGTDGTGTFSFGVNNVSDLRNGSHTDDVFLSGNITGATFTSTGGGTSAVPEPTSILLLGTVAIGFAFTSRRRFSQK